MCNSSTVSRVGEAVGTGGLSETIRAIDGGGTSGPDAPNLPAYPGLTPEEKDILQKQGVSLDQLNSIISGSAADLSQNQAILKQLSGLYDSSGNLNQDALKSLKSRAQTETDQRTALGQKALGYLSTFFDPTSDQTQTDINNLETTRYKNALDGKLPVSQGLQQQQQKDFQLLKESAGQRGIKIEGDTPDAATSQSTAGIQMLAEFNKRYDVAKENERQAAITTGGQQNLARLGLLNSTKALNLDAATNLSTNFGATSATLGYLSGANASSPANLAPLIEGYTTSLGSLATPYATAAQGQFQQQTNQANASYSAAYNNYLATVTARNSFYGGAAKLVGQLGAAAITAG